MKGLFCSGRGEPTDAMGNPTTRACRLFCRASTACAATEKCFVLGTFTPPDGFCVPSCTVFGAAGECASGMACAFSQDQESDLAGVCETTGPGTQNAECNDQLCAANFICIGDGAGGGVCAAACDTVGGAMGTHPCPAGGGTCMPLMGAPTGFGVCH
jgi:hypothetical protein